MFFMSNGLAEMVVMSIGTFNPIDTTSVELTNKKIYQLLCAVRDFPAIDNPSYRQMKALLQGVAIQWVGFCR